MEKTYVLKKSGSTADLKVDYAKELNEEQLAVVTKGDGPCLVLAGAGSGKTRTIVYRVAYLLERGVMPEEILLLTFTNKAAREMRERAAELIGAEPTRMWNGTFHHVCHRILRISGEHVGLKKGFTILDQEDARDLMKISVRECGVDTKARRFPSPAVLLSLVSYARNARQPLDETVEAKHPNFHEIVPEILRAAERYEEKKRASNAVDFDDLLLFAARLLSTHEPSRRKYARRFRYILVDEYQDTNGLQAEIVRALSTAHGNVLVVGDDAQSIYSFRGADIGNILSFPDIFPGAKTFRLETNYRSAPEILELANDVIEKNANRFEKRLRPARPAFAKPSVVSAVSAAQEAEFVAQRILELRDEGTPLREMAVLFRATHHSQSLEFELMKRDIPYEYRGGKKFFDRAHVKDALAFLKLMQNKDDLVAWTRALSFQIGIGAVTAERLYERVRSVPSLRGVDKSLADGLPERAQKGWEGFLTAWRGLLDADGDPSAMVRSVIGSDYARYLESEYPNYRERLEDLRAMADFAGRYDDLEAFLSDVSLQDDLAGVSRPGGSSDDEDDRLVLSTIHQAKGLEWDAVFVIHMAQGHFPNRRAVEGEGGVEEERRLFYVAATRARRDLVLSHPMTVGQDAFSFGARSEFLEELDPRLYDETAIEEDYDDLPTVELDGPPRRKGLLKDASEY
jgi:DNA helicase-2/ATP-dependent DNA helicase PcrA